MNSKQWMTKRFWATRQGRMSLWVGLALVLTAVFTIGWTTAVPATAAGQVAQAWQTVQQSDSYAFSARIESKTVPLPTVGNIGRFSKTDTLYLEGHNDLRAEELQLALWGGGVNVLDQQAAYQMHLADGRVQTRVGDEPWQQGSDLNVGFAPEGDFLAFLDAATDIESIEASSHTAETDPTYTLYQFNLDGAAYAQQLVRASQKYFIRTGQLPAGAALQVPDSLQNITGTGELWVDERGLPVRQFVSLNIPAAAGADYRTEAVLDVQFTSFESAPSAAWGHLAAVLGQLPLPTWGELFVTLGSLGTMVLFTSVLVHPYPRRYTYGIITSLVILLMLATPFMQTRTAEASAEKLATFKANQEEQTASADFRALIQPTASAPFIPPALSAPDLSSTLDSDGDGLTDAEESLLGTNPQRKDTDYDSLDDHTEIIGFALGGQTWYGDPTKPDSNGDGVIDSLGWNLDTDGDGTPDLYDFDDDNDGVPDKVDISRLVASKANNGTAVTFTHADPLQLNLNGLNPNSYTFVDMQLRPTNPNRLWYAFNVFNWPKDEKGNMQDWDGATFFDHCRQTNQANCQMSPNANGDVKFVPMLEISMTDLGNLPRTSNGAPDTALLDKYGISIQPTGNNSYLIYVPLNLVEDPLTGNKVAFQAQLVYQAGATWTPQQARMVWAINVLNESYADPDKAKTIIAQGNGIGQNRATILHAYADEFLLTGFNVREDRGVEMAIVYEDPALDPALNDDDALVQMSLGLEQTLLVNRDCDLVDNEGNCVGNGRRDITINEIYRRWNHPTNNGITESQRWGIGDYLRVQTYTFAHQDEATFRAGGEFAPQILDTHFRNTSVIAPLLLYVRESRWRTLNVDGGAQNPAIAWTGHSLNLDFSAETVIANASYNAAPYRYNTTQAAWEAFPTADYADHIRTTYAATDEQGPITPEEELQNAQAFYATISVVTLINGSSATISNNAPTSQTTSAFLRMDPTFFDGVDISDASLRSSYIYALNLLGVRFIAIYGIYNMPRESIVDLFRIITQSDLTNIPFNKLASTVDPKLLAQIQNIEIDFQNNVQRSVAKAQWGFMVFNAAIALAGIAGILALNIKGGKVAGDAITYAVGAVSAITDAITIVSDLTSVVKNANPNASGALLTGKILSASYSLKSAAAKTAAVGAIIGIALSWVMFFAAWGTSGLAVGSTEFNNLLAGTFGGSLILILFFFVSLTVVGAIVLAVIAVFDLIAFIICKAGVRGACDIGITAALTQAITDFIYQGEAMIDIDGDPAIVNIDDLRLTLTNPAQGLVSGNSVRFTADLLTFVRHNNPKPSVVYHYGSFYTDADLRSSTVRYTLGPVKQTIRPQRFEMSSWWATQPYDIVTSLVPSPGIGWLVPTEQSKTLWQAAQYQTITSPLYDFASPQINQNFPLWLNTGMALPRYDCWFSVCQHKTLQAPTNTDLSTQFYLDVLPPTIDGFYAWNQLGTQIDWDGDGLPRTQDPNDLLWDTDGDTVPDGREIEYGSSPTLADKDNDGLNDALEIRYETNPNNADTDGDGLNDNQEATGYLITINGYTFRTTSNPLERDSDGDGLSDGAEYRLNQLDPTLYPFNPSVTNDSPVRLYTRLGDTDAVLALGAQTPVTTTVLNGLKQDSLLSTGHFTATLPTELGGTTQSQAFTLLPTAETNLVQTATAGSGNAHVTIQSAVSANLLPVGNSRAAVPNSDILLDNPVRVTIDTDNPNLPTLTAGQFVEPGVDVIIGGQASDPTSYIALVEVSVNGGAFMTATGTSIWAFPLSVPNQSSGNIPIIVRATDAVGFTRSASFNVTIDNTSPVSTIDLAPSETRTVRRDAEGQWTLALTGNSSDALAGLREIQIQIGSSRAVTVPFETGTSAWSFTYPFDSLAFNSDPQPTGPITLTMTTWDNALPYGNVITQVIPFVIDMTAPTAALLSHEDDFQLTDGALLTGTVQDAYTAVSALEIAFVPAETVFATNNALLHLPLNDLPETLLFNNVGTERTRLYCLNLAEDCPTSYVAGTDGTAAFFDGDDLLRPFDALTLPTTEFSIDLWFNTTCANCGLFSTISGEYPTITQHDRDIFLDGGKVCTSILTGGSSREVRCSVTNSYNDGQWHQLIHTLGANGNRLYMDGQLAVSSSTTASTFATQDGVLIGHSPAASVPFLTGRLDDVIIYEGALSASVAPTLYRQWQPVTLIPSGNPLQATWAYTIPLGLEGYYQVDMRSADTIGNRNDSRGTWPQLRGPIDTAPPSFEVSVSYSGAGNTAQTRFIGTVRDANLTTDDYAFVCNLTNDQLLYETDPIEFQFTQQATSKLTTIAADCTQNGFQNSQISLQACDSFGHCAAAVPPQTAAFIGTRQNTLKPFGTLPNAIERTVLSDPANRQTILARPGQIITDIALDEPRGHIYWGEMTSGDYAQPAAVWRANLDGSNPVRLVNNLTAYAPEALQIAIDPIGNKLYWTQGYQLWWANLDGSLPQVVYAIPDDTGFIGGNRDYHHIGDVAVDSVNNRLILSERRLRFDRPVPGVNVFNHSLLVQTALNGTSPSFLAGAGPGCTYANFYQNVGAGLDPTLCVDQNAGIDIESVAAFGGTAYWSAVASGWTDSAVYSQPFGGATTTVGDLELNSTYPSLRMLPLPNLYVAPNSTAVYVSLGEQIVRGEQGAGFSQFSTFRDETPAPVGTQARQSSELTAFAVVQLPQTVQTQPDLAVSLTSPALVMLNSDTARYDVVVRNLSGLPADGSNLALTLPTGATFATSDAGCLATGQTVNCDLGRLPAFDRQTLAISFTVSVVEATPLTTTAVIASTIADSNPNDNTAVNDTITAAPTLASLPGVPYIYYTTLSELVRVPLIGDPNPEPIQFDNGGASGNVFAIDNERGHVFINDAQNRIVRANLDGSNFTVLADSNPDNMPTQDANLSIAVDTTTGRIYWNEVGTLVYNRIKSSNPDGSDIQTVVPVVYGQRGLLFDPVRSLLYWVALDSQERQVVIYRSQPNGSGVEVAYTAPAGADIRNLALDPYAQKLYWLDPTYEGGALFWADSDGGRVEALLTNLGSTTRGLVVQPFQNTLYLTSYEDLLRTDLDGTNETAVTWLGHQRYYGVSNRNPLAFPLIYINPPQSNLAFGISTPFAPSPCIAADTNEPNDTTATATPLGAGNTSAALCRATSEPLGLDQDVYQIAIPAGQAITATLSNLPANYGLFIQIDGFTVDVSNETGTADEQAIAANYHPTDTVTATLTVFSSEPVNNPTPYNLNITLGTAPFNGYTDAQCLAVDPQDLPGDDGNHNIANATPLTVGTAIQGALCYDNDSDYYSFNGTAGQVIALDLPVRPANYSILLYAPNGSFRQAFTAPSYGQQVSLDVTGSWKVLVRDNILEPTNQPYQLLVTDLTCGQNDTYEPNNVAAQAADITATSRVFASLCAPTDLDFFTFQSGANQQLTLNYPTTAAGGSLTLYGDGQTELGRVTPGTQGQFLLTNAGWYTVTVANPTFSGTNATYMFQWQLAAPAAPTTDTPYVIYTNGGHLVRVAQSDDHTVEPILLNNGRVTWDTLASDPVRGWLYFYDLIANAIVRTDPFGITPQIIINDANPGGVVNVPNVALAVDEASGRIYWLQPTGASASTASFVMRSNSDGTGTVQVAGNAHRGSLLVDSIQGYLYWTEGAAIRRTDLDGNGLVTVYTAANPIRDLALDPYTQTFYWLDPNQQTLFRATTSGQNLTALATGLDANSRGIALQPLNNSLFYNNGTALMRAQLDGSLPATIATLSGQYQGPSNLNPGSYLFTPIGTPESRLVIAYGNPIVTPCALANTNEPNDSIGTATPLTVITTTITSGALCDLPDDDYYHVTLADQKTLSVTLSSLPADYRILIFDSNGRSVAFSDNTGLSNEYATATNTSGAPADFYVLVMTGYPNPSATPYELTLNVEDVPPPPDPGDADCYWADQYDAPAPGGNGTLGTATDLPLGTALTAALCYNNDVDMYGFDGVSGQQLTIDLPVRPADYTLTLYNPSGTPAPVTYGALVTLNATGRWTLAVSDPALVPTTDQYQLLVTDESCVDSDPQEPNNTAALATTLTGNGRTRASLCSDNDTDLYRVFATAGQQLTVNYPTNLTGADLAITTLGPVSGGTQGIFAIASTGWYTISVANNGLSGRAVPYHFQLQLGDPPAPSSGTPYIYYSQVSHLTRVDAITRTIEPILMGDGTFPGNTIAADTVRGKLYILDFFERIVRANFDGTGHEIVIADADPNNVLRFANGLAVDETTGRIYWMQPTVGLVTDLMSANGDGSDVQTVVTGIVREQTVAIDPVGGWVYWTEESFLGWQVITHIKRANLDGTAVSVIYVAQEGRTIQDLAIDPLGQKLYWLDTAGNRLMWANSDGSNAAPLVEALTSPVRGIVVRPLANELYYTSGTRLLRAELDGSNPTEIQRLEGTYNGVSNLDPNAFLLTGFTTPSSNLVLGFSQPFAQPCTDAYEPNNSPSTAAPIGTGTLSSVLCTQFINDPDNQDYYQISVPNGQQITATLTNLPQNYGLQLLRNGSSVAASYLPGTADEFVTALNETGNSATYYILVERFGDANSSNTPYDLTVTIGDPPPPPPPPPPPGDPCAAVDIYDAPGALGNGSQGSPTHITYNTPITAALCYVNDADYYTFDGLIGQNVTIDLPVRPADYYVLFYKPDGSYFRGIFPGSGLTYGDSITLNESGTWKAAVWHSPLVSTTDQYQLLLSVNANCSGLDTYEPNDDQFNPFDLGALSSATVSAMLCETSDIDYYSFDVVVGQRVRINPRVLTPGMEIFFQWPGGGWGSTREPIDSVINVSGAFNFGIHSGEAEENLPYQVDIQIDPVPAPTPLPNNWSCTTYPSTDIPQAIDDLTTVGSTVNVPVSGVVTHVGLRDIVFDHNGLWNLDFGLGAPDGTFTNLFTFGVGNYNWCGGSNCHLSLDDGAIPGLVPPAFPNDGGTYQPNLNSFASFEGLNSQGDWTLYISDNAGWDIEIGSATGDLYSWSLEVCVDNGNPPNPTPTPSPSPTSTPVPQPPNGTPVPTPATSTPTPTPTALPTVCVALADSFEPDNNFGTAAFFDQASRTSGNRTFHTINDADWMRFTAVANRLYTFDALTVGTDASITLFLYASDGTTLITTSPDQVSFTPTVAGDYYLVARSAAGLVLPCNASYVVAMSVENPDATPVPTPSGTPVPPGHERPSLSGAILSPASGTVLTQTVPLTVEVGLAADAGLQTAVLLLNGSPLDTHPSAPAGLDAFWSVGWTPASTGVYSFSVALTDTNGMTATSPVSVFYVDTAAPSVSMVSETITQANLQANELYTLNGTAADDSRIGLVEVQINGGAWQEAALEGEEWFYKLAPLGQTNPNGGTLAITVRATDMAGRTTTTSGNLILDVTPPDLFAPATSLTNGTPITPTELITDLESRLSWPVISGTVQVYAGWTTVPTPTLGALTPYGAGAGQHDQTQGEGAAVYGHVVAVDANGNQTTMTNGLFYFDTAQTPDVINDLALANWPDSGGKQVGQVVAEQFGQQQLFAGWNEDALRLRWHGVNVDSNADITFYLSRGGSGTTALLNPAGADVPAVLPFSADYAVRVSGSQTATLYAVIGGFWTAVDSVEMTSAGLTSDVLLAWSDLGVANPAATAVRLLAVGTLPDETTVWATMPDKNNPDWTTQPWTQYIEWTAVGSGLIPAAGVWADAPLDIALTADPDPAALVGVGDVISLTLTYSNTGTAALPQLTLSGTDTGGVNLSNAPQTAVNIGAGMTGTLTLLATVNGDGTASVTVADSYHRPYALGTLTYTVDTSPPDDTLIALTYVGSLTNTIKTVAQDESPLASIEVEITGGSLRQPMPTEIVICLPSSGTADSFSCAWRPGSITDGDEYTLRGRATDIHGNVSGWSDPVQVTADATAPVLALSAETQAALADGQLNQAELTDLAGTLTDERSPETVQLCLVAEEVETCATAKVLTDESWVLTLASTANGQTSTLSITGFDGAGNPSQPYTQTVWVDTVAPVIEQMDAPETVVLVPDTAVPFNSGTAEDASQLSAARVVMILPNGGSAAVDGTVTGNNWQVAYPFTQTGAYQAVLLLTDGAGNQRYSPIWEFWVDMQAVAMLTVTKAGEGTGTVTSDPAGLVCGETCVVPFVEDSTVTLTAVAETGSVFVGWSGACTGTAATCVLTMSEGRSVTATFARAGSTIYLPVVMRP